MWADRREKRTEREAPAVARAQQRCRRPAKLGFEEAQLAQHPAVPGLQHLALLLQALLRGKSDGRTEGWLTESRQRPDGRWWLGRLDPLGSIRP